MADHCFRQFLLSVRDRFSLIHLFSYFHHGLITDGRWINEFVQYTVVRSIRECCTVLLENDQGAERPYSQKETS